MKLVEARFAEQNYKTGVRQLHCAAISVQIDETARRLVEPLIVTAQTVPSIAMKEQSVGLR